jgi:hypothetical protein
MLIPRELIDGALWLGPEDPRPDIPAGLTTDELGRLYAEHYPPSDPEKEEDVAWVSDLMYHLVHEAPHVALDCIVSAARQNLSAFQVSCIAAGELEDIIADHGPVVIERIEALAQTSARFRYMLSGVWTRGEDPNGEIWQRVLRARTQGPDLDRGDPLPLVDL